MDSYTIQWYLDMRERAYYYGYDMPWKSKEFKRQKDKGLTFQDAQKRASEKYCRLHRYLGERMVRKYSLWDHRPFYPAPPTQEHFDWAKRKIKERQQNSK